MAMKQTFKSKFCHNYENIHVFGTMNTNKAEKILIFNFFKDGKIKCQEQQTED